MSPKLFTIIKREYVTRVRTRGFVLLTLLVPALLVGYIYFVVRVANAGNTEHNHMAVVDLSHQVYGTFVAQLDDKLPDGSAKYEIEEVNATPDTLDAVSSQLRERVLNNSLDSYLVIPADVLDTRKAEYHTRNAGALSELSALQADLRGAITRVRLQAMGIPAGQLPALLGSFDLNQVKVSDTGDKSDRGQTFVLAFMLGMLLYMTLLIYGVTVMRSVTQEKTSRVSEILLSSVDSFSLMLGKILGVAGMGFTQYAIWGTFLAIFGTYGLAMAHLSGTDVLQKLPHIGAGLIVVLVAYFVLGFLVYASLYAAIGAMVSTDQEAQQAQLPVTMLLVVGIVMANLVLNNPASTTSIVLSEIPFFAPILMTMRVTVSNPPLWQILLSMGLCVATLLILTKFTAKIYRVGILMTGKKPNLPELMKWLKYA